MDSTDSARSFSSAGKRVKTYGTLPVDSIAFRNFEIGAYFKLKKDQQGAFRYTTAAVILLWPITWIYALLLAVCCRPPSKMQRKLMTQSLVATSSGILWCGIPWFLICKVGHNDLQQEIWGKHSISIWEVVGSYLDHILILLCMSHAYLVYQVSLNVAIKRKQSRQSWDRRRDEHGMCVDLEEDECALSPRGTGTFYDAEHHTTTMSVTNILEILEGMPGWKPSDTAVKAIDYQQERYDYSNIVFTKVADIVQSQNGLHPIERMMMQYPHFDEDPDTVWQRFMVFNLGAWFTIREAWGTALQSWRAPCCIMLAMLRASLPRLWVRFWFKGALIPPSKAGLALVVLTFLETFLATLCLLVLFIAAESRYGHTQEKLLLVSALVDPELRLECGRMLKNHEVKLDFRPVRELCLGEHRSKSISRSLTRGETAGNKANEYLCNIPLLKLTKSNNVRAFGRLREYVELERIAERFAVREIIEILLTWVCFNSVLMLMERKFNTYHLTAGVMCNTYDYIVASLLVVMVLRDAMNINHIRRMHIQTLHDSRYRTTMRLVWLEAEKEAQKDRTPAASHALEDAKNSDGQPSLPFEAELTADCNISIRLQNSMIHHFEANDSLDHPLFGVEMTPSAFIGIIFTIIIGFATLLGLALTGAQVWKKSP